MNTLVLDTSAFIQGFDSNDQSVTLYTTPLVVSEIREEMTRIRIDNWVQTGKLCIMTPEEPYQKTVSEQSIHLGEREALSATDHSVIALALQLSKGNQIVTLISDDYGVQNLSDELGIKYRSMITRGIKDRLQWITYCPGCRKIYKKPPKETQCPICGTDLKRKPRKKPHR